MLLADIADALDGTCLGDSTLDMTGIGDLDDTNPQHLRVVLSGKFLKKATQSVGVAFITYKEISDIPNQIVVKNPKKALAQAIRLFHPERPTPTPTVSEKSDIDPTATVGGHCSIGAFSCIGANTSLGHHVSIGPNVVIGQNCHIGAHTTILSGTVLQDNVSIGSHVRIGTNNSIGIDGFGFYREDDHWHRLPHVYGVIIEDHVELGSFIVIARGCLNPTIIKQHSKLDSTCHIAHNCVIGEDVAMTSHIVLAGSVSIGDHTVIAGEVGIAEHTKVGEHCTVLARSGITKDMPDHAVISGYPAQHHRDEISYQARLRRHAKKRD